MQNATVTGWGRNSLRSKRTSSVLKKYTAPVDDIDTCVKSWTPYPAISAIKGMHLCLNVTYGTPCHVSIITYFLNIIIMIVKIISTKKNKKKTIASLEVGLLILLLILLDHGLI